MPQGTLVGVMYSYSGVMVIQNDFFIWLSSDAIVEQIVLELSPQMKVKQECMSSLWSSLGCWMGAMDGSDSSSVTLIWDTEEGEQKIQYSLRMMTGSIH